jgi:hypothetical protein
MGYPPNAEPGQWFRSFPSRPQPSRGPTRWGGYSTRSTSRVFRFDDGAKTGAARATAASQSERRSPRSPSPFLTIFLAFERRSADSDIGLPAGELSFFPASDVSLVTVRFDQFAWHDVLLRSESSTPRLSGRSLAHSGAAAASKSGKGWRASRPSSKGWDDRSAALAKADAGKSFAPAARAHDDGIAIFEEAARLARGEGQRAPSAR